MEKGRGIGGKKNTEKKRSNALLTLFPFVIALIEMKIGLGGPLPGLIAVGKFKKKNLASSQTSLIQSLEKAMRSKASPDCTLDSSFLLTYKPRI